MVVGVGTHVVDSVADLQERLYTVAPGTAVQLHMLRGGKEIVVPVRLADSPDG